MLKLVLILLLLHLQCKPLLIIDSQFINYLYEFPVRMTHTIIHFTILIVQVKK